VRCKGNFTHHFVSNLLLSVPEKLVIFDEVMKLGGLLSGPSCMPYVTVSATEVLDFVKSKPCKAK